MRIPVSFDRTRRATVRSWIFGSCLLGVLGAASAGAASLPSGCAQQEERLHAARSLYQSQRWEEALTAAGRVALMPDCALDYVRAQLLTGRILSQRLDRIDEGIAAYQRALSVDRRQTQLWYELGLVLYRSHAFGPAMEAAENALIHLQTTPPADPERFLVQCRRLHAESADRLAMLSLGRNRLHVQRAIASWQDYQDYCEESGRCMRPDLEVAAHRLKSLGRLDTHQR